MAELKFRSEAHRQSFYLNSHRIWLSLSEHAVFYPLFLGHLGFQWFYRPHQRLLVALVTIQVIWTASLVFKIRKLVNTYWA